MCHGYSSLKGLRTAPELRVYGLRSCLKRAEYWKIVEATEIVGSRRIVGSPCGDRAKTQIGIVRSSQANRRPDVA